MPALVALLRVIFSQFELIPFLNFRRTINYRLAHNSQVCYLRSVLNDRFDAELRRIVIGEGEGNIFTVVYWREREQLVAVPMRENGALNVGWRGTVTGGSYDFSVLVPLDIWEDLDKILQMTAIIREYKLASKQFIIKLL